MNQPPSGNVQVAEPITLSPAMLICFAMIIQSFARLESMIQITIAAVGEIDLNKTLILTRGVSYQGKRDVLFSLMEDVALNSDYRTQIRGFLDAADKYTGIRNDIAHSNWGAGTRPDSIKPLQVAIRWGKLKYCGVLDDEKDYIEADLVQIADKLALINNSYMDFLRRSGLLAAMEQKIAEIASRMSSSLGDKQKSS